MTRTGKLQTLRAHGIAIWIDQRGTAGIEFAFVATLLIVMMFNVIDVGRYAYQSMEVGSAAEMGAQAAWATCDQTKLPATTACSGLTAAMTAAIQGTSLGSKVTLSTGSPTEGYYCVSSSKTLQYMSAVSSKPADCTKAGTPSLQPGDYIQVQVTFAYTPMFAGLTVASAFPRSITKTAYMRLG